jgi:hypothetical protein
VEQQEEGGELLLQTELKSLLAKEWILSKWS